MTEHRDYIIKTDSGNKFIVNALSSDEIEVTNYETGNSIRVHPSDFESLRLAIIKIVETKFGYVNLNNAYEVVEYLEGLERQELTEPYPQWIKKLLNENPRMSNLEIINYGWKQLANVYRELLRSEVSEYFNK